MNGRPRAAVDILLLGGDHAAALVEPVRLQSHALSLREFSQLLEMGGGARREQEGGTEVLAVRKMHLKAS